MLHLQGIHLPCLVGKVDGDGEDMGGGTEWRRPLARVDSGGER